MDLPDLTKRLVEAKLRESIERRFPPETRNWMRGSYEIRGSQIEIFEERPDRDAPDAWRRRRVARVQFDAKSGTWTLYCRDRHDKLHPYDLPKTADFDTVAGEIERDPTGIFWG